MHLYQSQKYINTNHRNAEIQITEFQKSKLQKFRNTNYRIIEIQVKQKFIHNTKVNCKSKVTHKSFIKYELCLNLKYGCDLCVNMSYVWIWIMGEIYV